MSIQLIAWGLLSLQMNAFEPVAPVNNPELRLIHSATAFTEHACEEVETLHSTVDDVLVTVTFVNSTSREVTLMHVNKEGREERKADLQGGQSVTIVTHQSHVWSVRNDRNACHTLLKVSAGAGANETVTFAERQ